MSRISRATKHKYQEVPADVLGWQRVLLWDYLSILISAVIFYVTLGQYVNASLWSPKLGFQNIFGNDLKGIVSFDSSSSNRRRLIWRHLKKIP